MKPPPEEAPKPGNQPSAKRGARAWDVVLLVATAAGVILTLLFMTAIFARSVLNSPWIRRIPPGVLALFTVIAIMGTMVLCFLAFFRGRRDARRPAKIPGGASSASVKPYPEHAVVRTLVAKADEQSRAVPAGAIGTIVHVHPTPPSESPAYTVEVVLRDKLGAQMDAHLFDARHEELELRPEAPSKSQSE
jgi:hypothetical protein